MSATRIFRNFAALTGAQVVSVVTGMITVIVLARALGPEAYGVLGFGVAVISYFGLATNFGTDSHGVREISRDMASIGRVVGTVLLIRICFAVVFFVVLAVGLASVDLAERTRMVLLVQGFGLLFVALNLDFAFQGLQQMSVMAVRQIAAGLIAVTATVLLVAHPDDLIVAAAIPVAANLVTAVALFIYYKSGVHDVPFRNNINAVFRFLKRAAPVALMGVLVTIHINLDIVLLGFMRSEAEVGHYVAASRVFIIAVTFANLLHSAFLPALSAAAGDKDEKLRIARDYARIICFIGCGLAVGGAVLAPEILQLLFGEAFLAASFALVILMINVGFFHLAQAYGTPLLAWQSDKANVKVLLIGAAANLGLNLILIPSYGIAGAAVATLIAQVLMFALLAVLVRAAHGLRQMMIITKITALAALCGLPLVALRLVWAQDGLLLLGLGGIGFSLAYVTIAAKFGLIDLRQLRGMLSRKTGLPEGPRADL